MSSERPTFASAVTCIDGRVHEPVITWVKARFGVDHVDLVTQPGPDLREYRRAAGTQLVASQPIVSHELMAEDSAWHSPRPVPPKDRTFG